MAETNGFDVESALAGSKVIPCNATPRSDDWPSEDPNKSRATTFCGLLSERLGLKDFYNIEIWRASTAEVLGTALLVFALDTAVISSLQLNLKAPILLIAILIFLIVTILLMATAPISGGHINPTVTFSAILLGLVSPTRGTIYILAQTLGGVLGALALKATVDRAIQDTYSLAGCTVTVVTQGPNGPIVAGIDPGTALWIEIFCTFMFLFASVWMAFDMRQAKALGLFLVCCVLGMVLALMALVSGTVTGQRGYAGAGMNPARCFGPALVRGGHLWDGHWVFWVGPAIACVAFYLYTKIIPAQHFHGNGYKYDFFKTLKLVFEASRSSS